MNNEQLDNYDVVAIGAGPVGLATALGLQQRGIDNILVIDRTSSFRPVGHGIDLLPNGLKALKLIALDAYEAVKSTGNLFANNGAENAKITPQWIYKNIKGEVLRSIPLSFDRWMETYGEGRVSIGWYDLQTTLRKLLPESQVKANHRCINVVREADIGYVRVECSSNMHPEANPYAYWSETLPNTANEESSQTKTIRAKLVVAADGINSTVRRVLYGDVSYAGFQRPQYSGYAAIGCSATTDIPPSLAEELHQTFLKNLPIITLFNKIGEFEGAKFSHLVQVGDG